MITIPWTKSEECLFQRLFRGLTDATANLRAATEKLSDDALVDLFAALTEGNGEDAMDDILACTDDEAPPTCLDVLFGEMEIELINRDLLEVANKRREQSRREGLRPGYASLVKARTAGRKAESVN